MVAEGPRTPANVPRGAHWEVGGAFAFLTKANAPRGLRGRLRWDVC